MKKITRQCVTIMLLICTALALVGCSGDNNNASANRSKKGVDPFVDLTIKSRGLNGNGYIDDSAEVVLVAENGIPVEFDIFIDTSNNGSLSNGDTVHATLEMNYSEEQYEEMMGFKFSRTEADLVLNCFPYYAHENPYDVIKYFDGKSYDNAMLAIEEWMEDIGEWTCEEYGDMTAEYVGAIYYYQAEGNQLNSEYNGYNQLVLIYQINDGIVPGGWYTYLAPTNVVIGYEDGEKVLMLEMGGPLSEYVMSYGRELYVSYAELNHPDHFEYNGTIYEGHRTIEDCIEAYRENVLVRDGRVYDYVIASDNLTGFISVG